MVKEGKHTEPQSAAFLWTRPNWWRPSRCFPSGANGKTPAKSMTSINGVWPEEQDAFKPQRSVQYQVQYHINLRIYEFKLKVFLM